MIPQRNISLLSNRLARNGGRRIREDVLERDYCLAWFLAALSEAAIVRALAFKGGTALKRCYFGDYRFSEDLDFTLIESTPFDGIRTGFEEVYAKVREQSGIAFAFDRGDGQSHENSHTFFLRYIGPLPGGNTVKVDITRREHLAYPLIPKPVLRAYDEFADVPENRILEIYSLDEIAAEKIIALADRARNEPRDLYDLWHMISNVGMEIAPLENGLREKLAFRGRSLDGIPQAIQAKEARLKTLWENRLTYQMSTVPRFDEVFRVVRRALRQAGLP